MKNIYKVGFLVFEKDLNKFYKDVPPIENINHKGFNEFVLSYCHLLAKLVSENGGISMSDIYEFIESYDFW